MRRSGLVLLLGLGLAACRDRVFVSDTSDGGGADREPRDSAGQGDGPSAPLALDIAITGCPRFDVSNHQCAGTAPLTVTFSPVTSGALDQFLWSFGDGSASSSRAPVHTYTLPGVYGVSVTADGPSGSISRQRSALIAVAPGALGATCDVDAQCAAGLGCLCGSATTSCTAAFARGLCSRTCSDGVCQAGAVCADLSPPSGNHGPADAGAADGGTDARPADGATDAAPADGSTDTAPGDGDTDAGPADVGVGVGADAAPADATDARPADGSTDTAPGDGGTDGGVSAPAAPWQRPSCLAACMTDVDCGPGLLCRDLPGRAAPGAPSPSIIRWVKGCFAGYPLDLGQSCRAPDGQLRDDACTSGSCANLGSAGLCTAACAVDADCPSGTACATFGDGRKLCLRACRQAGTCTYDPLLACESPGAAGPLGFTVAGSGQDPTATYCAPRGCLSAANCGPAGVCTAGTNGAGHCVPK